MCNQSNQSTQLEQSLYVIMIYSMLILIISVNQNFNRLMPDTIHRALSSLLLPFVQGFAKLSRSWIHTCVRAFFLEPNTRADIFERNRSGGNLPETPAVSRDPGRCCCCCCCWRRRRGERKRRDAWSFFAFFFHFFQQERTFILHWAEIQAIHERWGYSGRKPPAPSSPPPPFRPSRAFTESLSLAVAP